MTVSRTKKRSSFNIDCRGAVDPSAAERALRKELAAIDRDREWVASERSDAAEEALIREFHYHMLRAEELRNFLRGCGISLAGDH
jgi:hypothetical protein